MVFASLWSFLHSVAKLFICRLLALGHHTPFMHIGLAHNYRNSHHARWKNKYMEFRLWSLRICGLRQFIQEKHFQARDPRCWLRDLPRHDAQIHRPNDFCLYRVGSLIPSLPSTCIMSRKYQPPITLIPSVWFLLPVHQFNVLFSSGNVSQGAQEVFQELPHEYVSPSMLHKVITEIGAFDWKQ